MKKVIFTAVATIVVAGAAFASIHTPAKQKSAADYTYYSENACNVEITCSDSFSGPTCAETFENTVLYNQPGCQVLHVVATPLGKLPAR